MLKDGNGDMWKLWKYQRRTQECGDVKTWQTMDRKIIKCVLDVKWECDVKVDMYVNKTEG